MFEDVPGALNLAVLATFRHSEVDVKYLDVLAAMGVNMFYLRPLFERLGPSHGPDYLDSLPRSLDLPNTQDVVRAHQLASNIFSLRREPGFPEICRRLSSRPTLRSAFYEASAAELFQRRGFAIYAKPEIGARGQDFDFAISASEVEANVEATAIEVREFRENTIRNALDQKRSQLPADKPAIIACFIPGAWVHGPGSAAQLVKVAADFLRGTRRINYLVFVLDFVIPDGNDAIRSRMDNIILGGSNPRRQSPKLDTIMQTTPPLPVTSEFHLWIEWLKSRLG